MTQKEAMRRALKRITKDEANRFNRKIYNATFSAIEQHITTPKTIQP